MSLATHAFWQASMLPPRGLLLALLGQAPLIVGNWPLRPNAFEVLGGLSLVAAGIVLNLWSVSLFERNGVGIRPFSFTPALVARGPYHVSRHPMYLGLVAIVLGLSVATGVLANIWSAVALGVWLHYAYVLPEERYLRDQFGAAYDEYCRRVPQWALVGR
jgi:protein-S-isoprenylcysteine O-methyltransferase Ste14